jgi:hypothetical protein
LQRLEQHEELFHAFPLVFEVLPGRKPGLTNQRFTGIFQKLFGR